MYSLPNRISLDPRVCIVRNSKIDIGSFQPDPTPPPTTTLFWDPKILFSNPFESKTAQGF
jgi:hypothetical protein